MELSSKNRSLSYKWVRHCIYWHTATINRHPYKWRINTRAPFHHSKQASKQDPCVDHTYRLTSCFNFQTDTLCARGFLASCRRARAQATYSWTPWSRVHKPPGPGYQIDNANYSLKFTVTTFKSRFSRCLNCLESFKRADSTPKMADFGVRENIILILWNLNTNLKSGLQYHSFCNDM
jgi:hypothetical protein